MLPRKMPVRLRTIGPIHRAVCRMLFCDAKSDSESAAVLPTMLERYACGGIVVVNFRSRSHFDRLFAADTLVIMIVIWRA